MTPEDFRQLIVDTRTRTGLTQVQFAKRAGIAQSTLSKIEKNGTSLSVKTLCKILKALNLRLTLEYL